MVTPKLNRRRLQYSLRSLLVVTLLASLTMAWVGTAGERRDSSGRRWPRFAPWR